MRSRLFLTLLMLCATSSAVWAETNNNITRLTLMIRDGNLAPRSTFTTPATCGILEKCFTHGRWNGRCTCDECARGMGWC
jgi:hypothetical protein